MARGDLVNVIGIEKISKDLDSLLLSPKFKRKIVDKSSKDSLKPLLRQTKLAAAVADQDLPGYFSTSRKTGSRGWRKPIKRGTLKKSLFVRKRKNWQGLIVRHGKKAVHDAWFWRFVEYGFMWQGWGTPASKAKFIPGKFIFRTILAGKQQKLLSAWMRATKIQLRQQFPGMVTKLGRSAPLTRGSKVS